MTARWKLILIIAAVILTAACREHVKEPSVAGSFYPADPAKLDALVGAYLENARTTPEDGRLIALVAPHAGYQYSGQVAAYAYRHLAERDVDTVILVGASHHAVFNGASVYSRGSLKTPLGTVKINEKLAASLLDDKAGVAFLPEAYAQEHSLEVQLPFLQKTVKNVKVVPILIGAPTRESFSRLIEKLTTILKQNEKAIIIASTDLSHYHRYNAAMKKDRRVLDAIGRMSVEELEALLSRGAGELCGGYPVILTMLVARNLGATDGRLYHYANSGDVTGLKERVVGYAAMGLYRSPLSDQERQKLLALAKKTVVQYVKYKRTPRVKPSEPRLLANGAAFVTINRNGNLRGCIGNIEPSMPLYQSVVKNAVAASSQDYRFAPLAPAELKDVEVELTILSPLEPLADAGNLEVGKHGLYIVKDGRAGILLPQVAVQYGWDAGTFLEQVCAKAGLPPGAWKAANLYTFTADIVK